MSNASHPTSSPSDQGMTVVEVIIAVMLLMAVGSGIALAVMGGSAARGSARLQSSLTSAGADIQEDLASDRRWMTDAGCVVDQWCDLRTFVRADSMKLKDVDGTSTLVMARAKPLDSAIDGINTPTEKGDRDGVVPDFYRIEVEIQASPDVAARYHVAVARSKRRFVTTIDPRGVRQVGSVSVEICKVINQADERMQIQGCATTGRSDIGMNGCAPSATSACHNAFNWVRTRAASDADPSPFVSMQRVRSVGRFRLVDSSGRSLSSTSDATIVDGRYVFQNVPAGEYRITGLPDTSGSQFTRWRTKEIPAWHGSVSSPSSGPTVTVEAGINTRALVMFRPRLTPRGIGLDFKRQVTTHHLGGLFTSTETDIGPYAPTESYTGGSAAAECARTNAYAQSEAQYGVDFHCGGIDYIAPNCAEVWMYGSYFERNDATGNWWNDENNHAALVDANTPPGEPRWTKEYRSHARVARFCTYFTETFRHKYYAVDGRPDVRMRNGAVEDAEYDMEPRPDFRHVGERSPGQLEAVIPRCTVRRYAQFCTNPGTNINPRMSAQLVPGLNSGVQPANAGTSAPRPADAVAANEYYVRRPAWLSGPLWVRLDGSLVDTSNVVHPAGATIGVVGRECMWTSVRFRGTTRGSCDPCTPKWSITPSLSVNPGHCSVLMESFFQRYVYETSTYYNWTTGAVTRQSGYEQIDYNSQTFNYGPNGWQCISRLPNVARGSQCEPWATGGGGTQRTRPGRHRSPKTGGISRTPSKGLRIGAA